jgi:hypothetical protein
MFKIRMQGQYGGAGDKKLGKVVGDVWRNYGFRDGIMRGYWVSLITQHCSPLISGDPTQGDPSLCGVLHWYALHHDIHSHSF